MTGQVSNILCLVSRTIQYDIWGVILFYSLEGFCFLLKRIYINSEI